MQVNGISSYNYAPKVAFRGEGEETATEKKPVNKKVVAGAIAGGAGLAALIAATAFAIKGGKSKNLPEGAKLFGKIKTGATDFGSWVATKAQNAWTRIKGVFHKAEKGAENLTDDLTKGAENLTDDLTKGAENLTDDLTKGVENLTDDAAAAAAKAAEGAEELLK